MRKATIEVDMTATIEMMDKRGYDYDDSSGVFSLRPDFQRLKAIPWQQAVYCGDNVPDKRWIEILAGWGVVAAMGVDDE